MTNRLRIRVKGTSRRGFTLIESALATVIIGTGVLAIMFAQQTFHRQNDWAERSATAMRLAGEIREMTINLPRHDPVTGVEVWGTEPNEAVLADWDDVDDFQDAVFSSDLGNGPISAQREILPQFPGWTQRVEVDNIDPFDFATTLPNGQGSMLRVRVGVFYQGPLDMEATEITNLTWIQPR